MADGCKERSSGMEENRVVRRSESGVGGERERVGEEDGAEDEGGAHGDPHVGTGSSRSSSRSRVGGGGGDEGEEREDVSECSGYQKRNGNGGDM